MAAAISSTTICPKLPGLSKGCKGELVEKTKSRDGTAIAFERLGDGQPVIVVGGATCDRAMTRPLAKQLAHQFTVFNYDRRGRGDSGDTAPYAVEREIEDIGALIDEAGGTAFVYGHSSGAGLALHAAALDLPITRLVLHEPPFVPDSEEERRISREYAEKLEIILAEDRRGDAVELFMTTVGMPREMVEGMRHDPPTWAGLEEIAPTLAYDSAVMGDVSRGGTIPADLLGAVTVPALVLCGGASPAWMIDVGRQVADAMPKGRLGILEGQEHVVAPEVLVPVLAEFFAG
jgi:pimeloyl-ACP methyl ester carboxylesterase